MQEIAVNTEVEGQFLLVELIYAGYFNMAAVASLRCTTRIKSFYDSLISNHKSAKVAIIAVKNSVGLPIDLKSKTLSMFIYVLDEFASLCKRRKQLETEIEQYSS